MYSVVNANPAYVLLAALDLLSGCEIRNSSGTFVSSPNFVSSATVGFEVGSAVALCQCRLRQVGILGWTKTIRTIKFPLQLSSVHRSAGGKTDTVCRPAKIFFFGIKICWI